MPPNPPPPAVRPRPPLFRALGAADPPSAITVGGRTYRLHEILKHDSWAATALYRAGSTIVVCKFNRVQPVCGLPMRWLGRRLAARELRFLRRLADLPNVPRPLGPVTADGVPLPNAAAREYLDGHPLAAGERVDDRFFPTLRAVLEEMHRRGMAYVDLHKRENVIVGTDGRPYLIDFQISVDATRPHLRWLPGMRWLLSVLCRSDVYHLDKHILRHRPDQAGAEAEIAARRPWWITLHRSVAKPFRALRRRLLVAVGVRAGNGMAVTEQFAEDAVRREATRRAA